MKKSLILFGTFLLAALSTTTHAQNYYVCDNGNDNNNGRSEAAPFKTYEKAMDTFNTMNAGDSILFCRGGTFKGNSLKWLRNFQCKADKPCTLADYGDPAMDRPKIVVTDGDAFSFINPGEGRPDGGYILKNFILMGSNKAENGVILQNEVNDVLIENMHIEGFAVGVHYSGANQPYLDGGNGHNDRIVLRNSTIMNSRGQGFFGFCRDCLFENNVFESNGTEQIFHHNFYLASNEAGPTENVVFRNNTLYRSALVDGICKATSWVAHGIMKNITIENNTIKEDANKANGGCWGLTFTPGYNYEESFTNIVIRNNRIINLGGLAIGCSSCQDVVIENNLIIDEGNVTDTGISIPAVKEDSLKSNNIKIVNNKIAINRNQSRGINIGGENSFIVTGNDISVKTEDSVCVRRIDGNASTDISSNICKTHEKVSVIDDVTQPEIEVVEDNNTQPPHQDEEPPVQADSGNDSPPNEVEPEPVVVVENEVPTQEDPATEQPGDNNNDAGDNNQNDNVADSGGSTSSPDTPTGGFVRPGLDNVTQFPTTSSSTGTNTTTEPVANVEQPSSSNTTQRTPSTSSNLVTLRNVLQAYREDLSNVDISECRVVARGRCLMR